MSSKKGGILKYFLGCGCLLLIMAVAIPAAGGYWLYSWAKEIEMSTITEWRPELDTELVDKYGVDFGGMGKALTRPMKAADADRFLEAHDWFYGEPESEKLMESLKGLNEGNLDGPKLMELWEARQDFVGLVGRFDEYIDKNGGYIDQTDSALRSVGTAASAAALALATGHEGSSDVVANQLVDVSKEAHGKVESADPKEMTKILKSMKIGVSDSNVELGGKSAKPALVALSRMPTESFETWKSLPESKRIRLIEAYQKQQAFVVGLQLNPVLQSGKMISILQDIP